MPATKIFAGMARSYTMGIIGVFSKNWNKKLIGQNLGVREALERLV